MRDGSGVGIGKHLDAVAAAHAGQPAVHVFTYPGAKHGFAQSEAAAYDPAAAELSEDRALEMLAGL